MRWRYGIEHEVAFICSDGSFADFSNTEFKAFQQIVDALPEYRDDYPDLRIGDAGIKRKRWYVEGYERFALDGSLTGCTPKGIEIRTPIVDSIKEAVEQLRIDFERLKSESIKHGYRPVGLSLNPIQSHFEPTPPLNAFEEERRRESPEKQTAHIPMMTYGPDLNISSPALTEADCIDAARKLTFYSPAIIPFSYSSPFCKGKIWEGLSARNYLRTGARPAALTFVAQREALIKATPSLTKIARLEAERGRIEFKSLDTCADFTIYAGLLSLIKGLILDHDLAGRADIPDGGKHRLSALEGFTNQEILRESQQILSCASKALQGDPDIYYLSRLQTMLDRRETPADIMKRSAGSLGSVGNAISASTY